MVADLSTGGLFSVSGVQWSKVHGTPASAEFSAQLGSHQAWSKTCVSSFRSHLDKYFYLSYFWLDSHFEVIFLFFSVAKRFGRLLYLRMFCCAFFIFSNAGWDLFLVQFQVYFCFLNDCKSLGGVQLVVDERFDCSALAVIASGLPLYYSPGSKILSMFVVLYHEAVESYRHPWYGGCDDEQDFHFCFWKRL